MVPFHSEHLKILTCVLVDLQKFCMSIVVIPGKIVFCCIFSHFGHPFYAWVVFSLKVCRILVAFFQRIWLGLAQGVPRAITPEQGGSQRAYCTAVVY